jgi:hypothetical protein
MMKEEKVLFHYQSLSEIIEIFERLSLLQVQHLFLSQSVSDQGCRFGMSLKIHCYPINVSFLPKGSSLDFFSLGT